MQKAIVAFFYTDSEPHRSILEINELLASGWRVASSSPMGGGITGDDGSRAIAFASLVVLEKIDA